MQQRRLAAIMYVLRSENVGGPIHRSFCEGGFTDIVGYWVKMDMDESYTLPVGAQDSMYFASHSETTSVIDWGSTFDGIPKNILSGGNFALPDVIDDRLFMDSFNYLLFIGPLTLILKISIIYTLNNKLNKS